MKAWLQACRPCALPPLNDLSLSLTPVSMGGSGLAGDAAHTRLAGFVKQVGKQGLRASFTMQSRPITQSGTASHQSGTGQLGICLQEVVLPTICVHILKGQNANVGISVSQGQLIECAPVAQWLERAAVTCSRTPRGRGFDTLRERIFCSHAFLLTHLFTPLPGLLYLLILQLL